jgi:putative ABC transport system permease protein
MHCSWPRVERAGKKGKRIMSNSWNYLKHSLHMFLKKPGFTVAAVAAPALGIGTNTAIFTVVNTVLLKPLTYPDSDRIVEFLLTSPQGNGPIASVTKFHKGRNRPLSFRMWPHMTLAVPAST